MVAAGWLVLLAGVGWATGRVGGVAALVTGVVAVGWAVLSTGAGRWVERAPAGRRWAAVAADVAVAAATLLLPAVLSGPGAAIAGGYPFSAVVVAAWLRGLPGAMGAAVLLSAATLARVPIGEAARPSAPGASAVPADLLSTVLFYVLAAAVLSWGLDVLRRTGEERDAAEAALVAERADRARAEERAATAAHLHDSVLQTLALIQRRSGDAAEVVGLARSQERSLRDWLAGRDPVGGGSFATALASAAADVEQLHRLAVEVVHVGDTALDERTSALVAATRESLVNAAKHAGVSAVQVYAEAEPGMTAVYVRDRGVGFDPGAVPEDRRGISRSIVERLAAVGGSARIRSRPGEGTEVELRLPDEPPQVVG
jgi:signal transduction histidine kinase